MTIARAVAACVASLLCVVACNRIDYAAGPLPTAPPLPPLAEPLSQVTEGRAVLFAIHEQRAVPLYCHDRGQRRLGADCVALLPATIEARLPSTAMISLRLAGLSHCTLDGKPQPAFDLIGAAARDVEPLGLLWSDVAYPVLFVPPVPLEHMPETPSQLRGMRDVCGELGKKQIGQTTPATPLTTWLVDLDGDGVRERLDDVRCVGGANKALAAQVVFLTPGRRPERTVPLRISTSASTQLRFDAVMDVDSNGVPEVVVSTWSPTSHRIEVSHLRNSGLESLGELACTTSATPVRP